MEKLIHLLILLSLIPRIGFCQDLNIPQISYCINKVDSLDQRVGLWIERFSHNTYAIRGYNEKGRIDGVQINLQSNSDNKYEIEYLLCFNDGLLSNAFAFDRGRLIGLVDSVRTIDSKMFPEISTIAEKCKNSTIGQYGIIQFFVKWYDETDGSLKFEGWFCDFLDENNKFDFEIDPFPIGVQRYYQDGKVIEKDETDLSIKQLLNMAGHVEYDNE